MKTYILSLLLLFGFQSGLSQDDQYDLNSISLSVIMPNSSDNLSTATLSKIESKIQHIVTRYGISGRGNSNEFLIYPKFEIFDEMTVEGMRNMVVVEVEFNLFIQQYSTKRVFSSYSKSLKGSGFTKQKAIINAISKINSSNKELEDFILIGKQKVITYYNNNCEILRGDAETAIQSKQYQKAIALLGSVPREAKNCYQKIQSKSLEAYMAYQDQRCNELVLKAKTEIAANNFKTALRTLSMLDPSSKCKSDAEALIRSTAGQIEKKEQQQWNLMLKKYEDGIELSRYRLQTTAEIAKAYYQSKPQTIIYKSLF